jgi:hypothetical protein
MKKHRGPAAGWVRSQAISNAVWLRAHLLHAPLRGQTAGPRRVRCAARYPNF